jgi:hypothetical protein
VKEIRIFHHFVLPEQITEQLNRIEKGIQNVAISQTQFDADLAPLLDAITKLVTAVNALGAQPVADLTAEDAQVLAAATQVTAAINKLNPPTPVPTPVPVVTP